MEDAIAVLLAHLSVDEEGAYRDSKTQSDVTVSEHTPFLTRRRGRGERLTRSELGDLLGQQLDARDRVAEDDALVDVELGEKVFRQ